MKCEANRMKRSFTLFAIVIIIFSTISAIAVGKDLFIQHKETSVTITALNQSDFFAQGTEIKIKGVEVDGKQYRAKDIFSGEWLSADNGGFVWRAWGMPENSKSITAQIPQGKERKLLFEGNMWSGKAELKIDNHVSQVDTYCHSGATVVLPIALNGTVNGLEFENFILLFAVFLIIQAFVLLLSYFMFFRGIDITGSVLRTGKAKSIILICSGMCTSMVLARYSMETWFVCVSMILSFPVYLYYLSCVEKKRKVERISWWVKGFTVLFSVFIEIFIVQNRFSLLYNDLQFIQLSFIRYTFLAGVFILVFFTACVFSYEVSKYLESLFKRFISTVDKSEKIYLLCFGVFIFVILIITYSHTSGFSQGYYFKADGTVGRQYADIVFGFDHSWILDSYKQLSESFYNIRHPLFRGYSVFAASSAYFFTLPIKSIFLQAYPMFLAFINACALMASAIVLKRLTGEKWMMPLLSCTYFFLVLCLGSEQYQISLFFIMAAIYGYLSSNQSVSSVEGIMMSGCTLTSGFLVPFLIPFRRISQYLYDLFRYCIVFLGILFASGTAYSIMPSQLMELWQTFGGQKYLLIDKLKVFSHFVCWLFVAPQATVVMSSTGNPTFSANIPTTLNWIGIFITLLCGVSFIVNRKQKLIQISFAAVAFSFVLCGIIGWAMTEAWLYAILFSWAYLILICALIKRVVPVRKYQNAIAVLILFFMLSVNLVELYRLILFCVKNYSALAG